jgi:SEC-C motif
MPLHANEKIGRNDPCPCGSGKKYKRCCLEQQSVTNSFWAQQRDESDELTRAMIRYARDNHEDLALDAWEDFHLGKVTRRFSWTADEQMIFMPYFLFHWNPEFVGRRKKALPDGGVIAHSFLRANGLQLSDLQRQILDQAMKQPVSFYQVVTTKPGESLQLADVLTGSQSDVMEQMASQQAKPGDLLYGSVWTLPDITVLGCSAPIKIPLSWKAEIIGLRKMLRRRIARQKRPLNAEDLLRYADEIRATYLLIRDSFNTPPRLCNTDGDPLVFHSLTLQIESAESTFEALAPLAEGRSKEELLDDAEFDERRKLRSVSFDWFKKGNSKISSWDNTILGSIKISEGSLVAEVNSEKRAKRLRDEIEKRLGANATHQRTVAQTVDEMVAKSPKRNSAQAKIDEETVDDILRDPEVRKQIQEKVQKQVEAWAYQKIPILDGRTPMQAVHDPDGREIVESLLLDWERRADEGVYQPGIRPDFNAVRKLLKLMPTTS